MQKRDDSYEREIHISEKNMKCKPSGIRLGGKIIPSLQTYSCERFSVGT